VGSGLAEGFVGTHVTLVVVIVLAALLLLVKVALPVMGRRP
jgi:hypothetical protein